MNNSETLIYLARTYFHQDYDLLAETPLGVIDSFIENETEGTLRNLRLELHALLDSPLGERDAYEIWMLRGESSYSPLKDSISVVEWLDSIYHKLDFLD